MKKIIKGIVIGLGIFLSLTGSVVYYYAIAIPSGYSFDIHATAISAIIICFFGTVSVMAWIKGRGPGERVFTLSEEHRAIICYTCIINAKHHELLRLKGVIDYEIKKGEKG